MGAGIIMLHLADVIDGSELELHLLIRDYYIPAVIIGAGLYIIARITHITGEVFVYCLIYSWKTLYWECTTSTGNLNSHNNYSNGFTDIFKGNCK